MKWDAVGFTSIGLHDLTLSHAYIVQKALGVE